MTLDLSPSKWMHPKEALELPLCNQNFNDSGDLQPVAYTSCKMCSNEELWAQIEKECLAIVSVCDKWNLWIYGKGKSMCIEITSLWKSSFRNHFMKPLVAYQKWWCACSRTHQSNIQERYITLVSWHRPTDHIPNIERYQSLCNKWSYTVCVPWARS